MTIQINNIGHNHCHPRDFSINRPNGRDDYLLLLLKSQARFIINQKSEVIQPNHIYIYKKGTPQLYHAYNEEFVNDWFHFDITNDDSIFEQYNIPLETFIPVASILPLSNIILNMTQEFFSNTIHHEKALKHYTELFWIKLSESIYYNSLGDKNQLHYQLLCQVRSQIYNQPYKKWDIPSISNQIHLSSYYFQHLYKKYFEVSCIEDLIFARIEFAKYHLSTSNHTIKTISHLCGYDNEEHFMRQFKRKVGITPSEYRKKQK